MTIGDDDIPRFDPAELERFERELSPTNGAALESLRRMHECVLELFGFLLGPASMDATEE